MPFGKCPVCGQYFHLRVEGDLKQWYETRWPGIPFLSTVPCKCYLCWQELVVGDTVEVRNMSTVNPRVRIGDVGIVQSILASEEGKIFKIQLASGREELFTRGEIC